MRRSAANRIAGATGLVWGCVLLVRGSELFARIEQRPPSSVERRAITVLGTRHAGQAVLQWAVPRFATMWMVIDLTHAASMLIVAALSQQRRRAALVSGAVAVLAALIAGSGSRDRRTSYS